MVDTMPAEASAPTSVVCAQHRKEIDDHEKRIRCLEKFQWRQAGVLAFIIGLAAAVSSYAGAARAMAGH